MNWLLKKSVVLSGMMGAGKTSVGRAIADQLGVRFLDSDEEIVNAANMSIAEIFARDGEAFFREKESQVLERLMKGPATVLSTGGGAYLSERNRQIIADGGVAVWLNADLDVLWNRVKHRDSRPLLRTPDPYATLAALYEARVPLYQKAEITVRSQGDLSVVDMADRVVQSLAQHTDILEKV
jgi:shikimate kinase